MEVGLEVGWVGVMVGATAVGLEVGWVGVMVGAAAVGLGVVMVVGWEVAWVSRKMW